MIKSCYLKLKVFTLHTSKAAKQSIVLVVFAVTCIRGCACLPAQKLKDYSLIRN